MSALSLQKKLISLAEANKSAKQQLELSCKQQEACKNKIGNSLTIKNTTVQKIPLAIRKILDQNFQQIINLTIINCDLRTFQNFPVLKNLLNLNASKNSLRGSFQFLIKNSTIKYLDVSSNAIRDISRFDTLRFLKNLSLFAKDNPFQTKATNESQNILSKKQLTDHFQNLGIRYLQKSISDLLVKKQAKQLKQQQKSQQQNLNQCPTKPSNASNGGQNGANQQGSLYQKVQKIFRPRDHQTLQRILCNISQMREENFRLRQLDEMYLRNKRKQLEEVFGGTIRWRERREDRDRDRERYEIKRMLLERNRRSRQERQERLEIQERQERLEREEINERDRNSNQGPKGIRGVQRLIDSQEIFNSLCKAEQFFIQGSQQNLNSLVENEGQNRLDLLQGLDPSDQSPDADQLHENIFRSRIQMIEDEEDKKIMQELDMSDSDENQEENQEDNEDEEDNQQFQNEVEEDQQDNQSQNL